MSTEPKPPGAEEVERVRLLTEDVDERKSFDRQSAQRGGPLANMAAILTIWSQLNPPQGSMAKLCAIMSNECAKAALPTTQPDRAAIRAERQRTVFDWGVEAFGDEQMHSPTQRGLRMAEEAIELAQATGCDPAQLHRLIDYIYGRPVGTIESEMGGVSVCLLALAQCCNLSADEMEVREVTRILSKPREHFTRRNAEKNEAGFRALARPSPGEER